MGFEKTMMPLAGRPVLRHVLDRLCSVPAIAEIVVVTSPEQFDAVRTLVATLTATPSIVLCAGGATRQESVERGVSALTPSSDLVLIHDAARPLVTSVIVEAGIRCASVCGAAVAAIPVSDTIKLVAADGLIEATPERARLYAAQTPQIFRRDWLAASYARMHAAPRDAAFTDEASLLEWAGYAVRIFPGSFENIKLTNPVDVMVAESILARREDLDR